MPDEIDKNPETYPDGLFVKSKGLVYLYNNSEYFIFHDSFGYLLGCSRDIIDLIEQFDRPRPLAEVASEAEPRFEEGQVPQFLGILRQFSCVIPKGHDERDDMWTSFVYPARWNLSYVNDDKTLTFFVGRRDGTASEIRLSPLETAFVKACNGDRTIETMAGELAGHPASPAGARELRDTLVESVARLVGHDAQVLKLARFPFSMFRHNEGMLPPYLRSTAHFDRFDPADPSSAREPPWAGSRTVSPFAYYRDSISDARRQFDEVETTLSHLFREPHMALAGEKYGGRFASILWERGLLRPDTRRIIEVGGGLGWFAASFLEKFKTLAGDASRGSAPVSYTILDASPVLMEAQREALEGFEGFATPRQIEGNAEEFEPGGEQFDLILCNEVIGDFTATRMKREEAASAETMKEIPEIAHWLARCDISFEDPPEEFFVNTGAMRFIERAWDVLRPGGSCVIVEFGDFTAWPILSSHLDHPEFSIRFETLVAAAQGIGFKWKFEDLPRFLRMTPLFLALSTTRPFYAALRHMLRGFGIDLEKIAYTQAMFEELVMEKLDLSRVSGLAFEPLEERCMGLSPKEFKVLTLIKPE